MGLFAVYRTTPTPFTPAEILQLQAVARTVGMLVDTRFCEDDLALHTPPPTLSVAVGMIMARLGLGSEDAVAVLRATAFRLSISTPALARRLASGAVRVEDLLDPPDTT